MKKLRLRFWVEVDLGVASVALLVVTLLWKDWIEIVFGVDPDNHSGSLEWLVVAVLLALAITFSVLARYEWRKSAVLPA